MKKIFNFVSFIALIKYTCVGVCGFFHSIFGAQIRAFNMSIVPCHDLFTSFSNTDIYIYIEITSAVQFHYSSYDDSVELNVYLKLFWNCILINVVVTFSHLRFWLRSFFGHFFPYLKNLQSACQYPYIHGNAIFSNS